MGLHCDVKKYLKARFPNAVNANIPQHPCEVQIVDLMWLLFKFFPEETAGTDELVDFFWRPIERFFAADGQVYVCVFDAPKYVPVAKAEEHRRRYKPKSSDVDAEPAEPVSLDPDDPKALPRPWQAALADRKSRALICTRISEGLQQRFAANAARFPKSSMFTSGLADVVIHTTPKGSAPCDEHAAVTNIGEGDIAVAYWAQHFHEKSVIVRVLDSDQIPILQLRSSIASRKAPLFIWLVNPRRDLDEPYHEYCSMPFEGHTLIDVRALNAEVVRSGLRVEEFCFHVICQKTDFVDKVIHNLGVAESLKELEKNPSHGIEITASTARCDATSVRKGFVSAVIGSKRKRAKVRDDEHQTSDVEFRRAWWTLCYWAFGWEGSLGERLRPRPAFGFDNAGMRTAFGRNEPYPSF